MLASRAAASGNARAAFLQLPPHLRALSHQQTSRSFSASASHKQINLVEIVTAPPLAVLNGLHTIGVPWYAAIPLSAVLIRGVFGYYFGSAPARRRQQIRNNAMPVLNAAVAERVYSDTRRGGDMHGADARQKQVSTFLSRFLLSQALWRKFGGGMFAVSSFVNFGTLIATAEAVRMKCGAREGLLSMVVWPFEALGRKIAPSLFPEAVDTQAARDNDLAERLERVRDARMQQAQEQGVSNDSATDLLSDNVFQSYQPPSTPFVNTDAPHFDPTLLTEGLPWCTDLTALDPSGRLAILTVLAMLSNVLLNPLSKPRLVSAPKWLGRPGKYMLQNYSTGQMFASMVSCAFYFVLQQMPAAIVLYVFSSAITGFVQRRWLDVVMPLRAPIRPCARPTRVRTKKAFSNR